MEKLKFYDVKGKKKFVASKYRFTSKRTKRGMTYFVVADAPSGIKAWRIVSKVFYMKNK